MPPKTKKPPLVLILCERYRWLVLVQQTEEVKQLIYLSAGLWRAVWTGTNAREGDRIAHDDFSVGRGYGYCDCHSKLSVYLTRKFERYRNEFGPHPLNEWNVWR